MSFYSLNVLKGHLAHYGGNPNIRKCSFCFQNNMLVTGGESGVITLWESQATNVIDVSQKITKKTEKKEKRKSKPY